MCSLTSTASFLEHAHCVWSCDFHHTGDFIATGSMDNTIKVWDLESGACMHTIRSHKDAVNVVRFQVTALRVFARFVCPPTTAHECMSKRTHETNKPTPCLLCMLALHACLLLWVLARVCSRTQTIL